MTTSLMSQALALPERAWNATVDLFWEKVDPRPYAIVRIGFAIASLFNWYELFVRRSQFFGPNGMIDGDIVRKAIAFQPYYSVFTHTRTDATMTAAFLVALVAIVALGVGFYTRVAAVLVYVFHLSYSHYAFPILHSWDALLRVYAFLVMLSPCGLAWSIDAKRAAARRVSGGLPQQPSIYGLRLMQWQLAVIYVSTVWLKVPDASWRNGKLLAYFQMSMYSRFPSVTLLAKYEILSNLLTYASLAIEMSVVFLLWSARLRWVGVFLGVSLHLGIAATSRLTVFSLCIVAPYGAFLTGPDVDRAEAVVKDLLRRARVLKS